MVSISMYRGNLHRAGADAERQWPSPRPTITAGRFRRLLRSRSLAFGRLDGATRAADSANSASSSRLADGDAGEAEEVDQQMDDEEHQEEGEGEGEEGDEQQPQQEGEEDGPDEQQPEEAAEEQDDGAVEDVDMDDAGEVVVGGDDAVDANGSGDTQEGQGESEGFDPNPEGDLDVIEEKKRELNDKLNTLNKKKHDLVQMLKQILNAEEEIRMHSVQASLRTAVPQPSENAADGSSVSRQVPRMTVDVNFSEVAVESDAGSNQGTPGRPLHHVHSISPSTASFARSPFGSLQHNYGHTPRSPATFSTASPSRFAAAGHQGHPTGHPSISLPGTNFVASSPSPAASGGSSSVFRDYRPPNST
ncbi:hypothetical protein GUJ93_ZPchr0003g18628 [Zizania palustris]|uniref:Uncharacterized protein n=1 Tax=Zizania palustris TaxID=103762 RepID=A0A8J5SKI9_ZIZPA|nr:hypothetical protein GUJ93_ZPchr0003g18628 [Zizania palustris]